MPDILAREGLPAYSLIETVRDKLAFIRNEGVPELVDRLLEASRKYEKCWNLEALDG